MDVSNGVQPTSNVQRCPTCPTLRREVEALTEEVARLKRELARRGSKAIESVARGVEQAGRGELETLGSFAGRAVCIHGSRNCQALACRMGA